jgi:uncharacterized membrane protein
MICTWLLVAVASLRNASNARVEHESGKDASGGEGRKVLRYLLPQAVRYASALVALVVAFAGIAGSLVVLHPIIGYVSEATIRGVILFNTLIPAYLLPALIILAAALMLPGLHRAVRALGVSIGGLLGLHWLVLVVAHAWRGPDMQAVSMGDGELWTYTAMLIVIGAVLMVFSLWKGSRSMRLVANGFLVLAIGKVFLVDAPDLDGLVRAGSFLILGLSLAGLAWINRLAIVRQDGTGQVSKA